MDDLRSMDAMRMRKHRAVAWAGALASATAVTIVILMPGSMVPRSHFAIQDKVEHILALSLLGGAWMMAVPRPLLIVTAGICYGIGTELLQKWMALGRTCDPLDALADGLGVVIGVVGYQLWARRRAARISTSRDQSA